MQSAIEKLVFLQNNSYPQAFESQYQHVILDNNYYNSHFYIFTCSEKVLRCIYCFETIRISNKNYVLIVIK